MILLSLQFRIRLPFGAKTEPLVSPVTPISISLEGRTPFYKIERIKSSDPLCIN